MKRFIRAAAITALAAAAIILPATAQAAPSHQAAASVRVSRITAAYDWAVSHARGTHYRWAGTGPSYYDCSGLVMVAYEHAGISLPHSTYAMLASGKLHRVMHPEAGDLAFFGTGHVELYAYGNVTFGAHSSSDPVVGFRAWSAYWHPTMFMRV